jgi:ABC-2 type transport system permease protein
MFAFWRLLKAEREKLRKSPLARLLWLMPLLFVGIEFFLFEYKLFGVKQIPGEFRHVIDTAQIKMTGALWGGFFYPMLTALLPALLFRHEHRNHTWRHLGAMPVPKAHVFFAKAIWALALSAASLAIVWASLWVVRSLMQYAAPQLEMPFNGMALASVLGWLWLGSLPVMSIYLWLSNRISSLAVPVVFGVVGILLSSALTSQEVPEPWKRDFIPWVTPNICTAQVLAAADANKNANLLGSLFVEEEDIIRLPSGRKIKTWQNIPDYVMFPPPPPTPPLVLASYSIVACMTMLILGGLDAARCRRH